jgi:hypothetical protein
MALLKLRDPEVVEHLGLIRFNSKRFSILYGGLLKPPLLSKTHPQVSMNFCIPWIPNRQLPPQRLSVVKVTRLHELRCL